MRKTCSGGVMCGMTRAGDNAQDANREAMWQDESGRVHTPFEPVVLGATLLLIPVLILEADGTGIWLTFANIANWLIWGVFAAELLCVMVVAKRKKAALRAHALDVAIVAITIPFFGSLLGWGRLARLLRLLRFSAIIGRALQAERRLTSGDSLRIASILTVAAVVLSGAIQFTVDNGEFKSLWDGVWWSVVTVTTVGYGDLTPKTVEGRIVAILVMLVGIAFTSLLTAAIAARFVKTDARDEESDLEETLRRIEADLAWLKARLGAG
jgi:voltage-gated potassium channel